MLTMEYYTPMKKKELELHTAMGMTLENKVLSKGSQT